MKATSSSLRVEWLIAAFGLAVPILSAQSVDTAKLYQQVSPAIVVIMVQKSGTAVGEGSGAIVSKDGVILSALHVISGGDHAAIKLKNGDVYGEVSVLAFDARRDLVALKIPGFDLPTVPLGNSNEVKEGDPVVMISNPKGLEQSIAQGIISGIRDLGELGFKVFQTTAPTSPGSSGGALISAKAELIGIHSFKLLGGENLNFQIPINYARGMLASTGSFPVNELAARLAGSPASPTPLVGKGVPAGLWTSMTTGNDLKIRVDGDYIYIDRTNWPAQLRDTEAFVRSELKKSRDKWVGKTRMRTPCNYDGRLHWCSLELDIEITSLTDSRIEGRAQADVSFNCGICQIKKLEWKPFVWIPKD